MWANAVVIVAGAMFGSLHEACGLPPEADKQVADALPFNILQGMLIGREQSLAMSGKPH
jgi:hypothetical protein